MLGRVISGKYRILKLIGSGGMAEVYKAAQLTPPHRTVAIKILKSEFSNDAAFLRRFEQEAQAVLVLSHENIVRSFDVGYDEGLHYIVLEYVEGQTLKERIGAQGKISIRTAINLSAQMLDALAHAHARGIIHRDVKPQNIVVNSRGRAKLADFGIARNSASDQTQTFAGGSVLGSVHYLSPEQAKGEPVTVESDIYSMGVTLYEMVTGHIPFEGDTSVTIALKHLQEQPVPPLNHNPTLPLALNDIILRAMQKDPHKRYHSAQEMKQDLLRVLRDPNGNFARVDGVAPSGKKTKKQGKKRYGVLRIGLMALVAIMLFAVLLLTGQSLLANNSMSINDRVPTLTGKPLEEARNMAKLRSFQVSVIEEIPSDDYESGVVLEQSPLPGDPLKSGGTIEIIISAGASMVETPDLTGKTLFEAEELLKEAGLARGELTYRVTEYPIGKIYKQDPAPETMLFRDDEVTLYISGEPIKKIEIPAVTGLSLASALSTLREWGFPYYSVFMVADQPGAEEGMVLKQTPAAGEQVANDQQMLLTVAYSLPYTASLTLSVDVPEDQSELTVILKMEEADIPYEQVIYECPLDAGDGQEVSFTAETINGGEQVLYIYLNGVEIRSLPVIFSHRG